MAKTTYEQMLEKEKSGDGYVTVRVIQEPDPKAQKSKITVPVTALQGASEKARSTANRLMKAKQGKPNSDYLRLDLMPAGEDLKGYVIKRAAEVSQDTGRSVSMSGYIQELIRQDMKRTQTQGSKHRLCDTIMALDADKLEVIERLLQSWR